MLKEVSTAIAAKKSLVKYMYLRVVSNFLLIILTHLIYMTRMRSEIIFLDKNPQGVHTSYIDTTGAKYIVYMKFVSSFHGILRTNFITTPVGLLAVLV